jgi:ABC-2 type transport system permease protein
VSAAEVAQGPLGRPIKGPSAVGGDLRRLLHLTFTLAVMEFKLRFFGSVLGYLWQLMRPLLLFGVLYVVFTEFVRLGEGVRFYPAVLLTGIVMFGFFSDATSGAVTSIVDRENLVRKVEFPLLVVPMAVMLTAYFNLVLNLLAVLVFVLATGVDPRWEWALFPLVPLALGLLAAGVSMLLSPLAALFTEVRHTFIDPSAPSAAAAAGGAARLAVPVAIVLGLLALGFWVFSREAPHIAEGV